MKHPGVVYIEKKVLDIVPGLTNMNSIYAQYTKEAKWTSITNWKKGNP